MKIIFSLLVLLSVESVWAWSVGGAYCRSQFYPGNKDMVTFTSVEFYVRPDAQAVLTQTTRLENNPPNVGIDVTEHEKFGFFTSRRKINPDLNPFAPLFGTPNYDGYFIENGTLYTRLGSAKPARVTVTYTKRYSDGEPNTARVDIFTKESGQTDWVLSESIGDCHLSVSH